MFVPRPQDYHGDACASLGAIWHLPQLEGKVRLNVLVMLTPQFHSTGPHSFSPEHVWPYGGLIVGGERYGLGVSDPDRINLVRLGSMEDALI